jgi:hypothetical protein
MKTLLLAGFGLVAAAIGAPAMAQTMSVPYVGAVQGYGTLGYANLQGNGADLSAMQGRLGMRFDRYFGIEAEAATGLNTYDPITDANGNQVKVGLNNQEAIYGVVFLPLGHGVDLFARGGFGGEDVKLDSALPTSYRYGNSEGWNYGGGAQYFFHNGPNGLRFDYTRYDYNDDAPNDNVYSLAFVHKF